MDRSRQLISTLLVIGGVMLWLQVAPILFPAAFQAPKPAVQQQNANGDEDDAALAQNAAEENGDETGDDEPAPDLPEFPEKVIVLGEDGFEAGYLMRAEFSSRGGALNWLEMTDPRYLTEDRTGPLRIVGNPVPNGPGGAPAPRTFEMRMPQIDAVLKKQNVTLEEVNWEVVSQTEDSVQFRYPSPDGSFEILRTYSIPLADVEERDQEPTGYLMDVVVEVRNLSDSALTTEYAMVGPVGLPLEDVENTRLYREVKLGTLESPNNPDSVTNINLTAAELVKQIEKANGGGRPVDIWREPLQYVGVDSQFFAALILPEEQLANPYFSSARPVLLDKTEKKERSDLSVILDTKELNVPANGTLTHNFQAFFGPKRPELLQPLKAEAVIQLGWFHVIAKFMLTTLNFFHSSLNLSYAWCIILLTVIVRLLMLPISKKQVAEAEKMKILAPKLKEIQEKHKNQPEEFAKAYREFQKKYNYHPLVGCLPALLQLPIFIGLYNSLFHAVDLRLARFFWIDNLAAPDAFAPLPFVVPWFGWTELNLLPIITVGLFIAQQKMFTPPPTSEEQAMQYKMMNVMMIAIGFAFYKVPAGLCLYFIASSLWGICERMILKKNKDVEHKVEEDLHLTGSESPASSGTEAAPKARPTREIKWLTNLMNAADQAKNATGGQNSQRKYSKPTQGKKSRR